MSGYLELYTANKVATTQVGGYAPFGQDLVNREIERSRITVGQISTEADTSHQSARDLTLFETPGGEIVESAVIMDAYRSRDGQLELQQTGDADAYRDYFSRLHPWQQQTLNGVLDSTAYGFIKSRKSPDTNWSEHLVEATPRELVNFVEWNAFRTIAVNELPSNQELIETGRNKYAAKVIDAVKQELLPEQALEILPIAKDIPVVFGDVFNVEMMGRSAYHDARYPHVVLGQTNGLASLDHEMGHTGLVEFPVARFNEGLNEHVKLGLNSGDFTTLDPFARTDGGTYLWNRYAVSQVAEAGIDTIPSTLFIETAIEKDNNGPKAVELASRTAASFPGMDNLWAYAVKRADEHTRLVGERFPQAPEVLKQASGDMYAGFSIFAVGQIQQRTPAARIRANLDGIADGYQARVIRTHDANPNADLWTQYQLRLDAFTSRRVAQDFEQQTAFLA